MLCVPCGRFPRRADGSLQASPVDENHPISGRTPRDLCASGNWRELSFSRLTDRGQIKAICEPEKSSVAGRFRKAFYLPRSFFFEGGLAKDNSSHRHYLSTRAGFRQRRGVRAERPTSARYLECALCQRVPLHSLIPGFLLAMSAGAAPLAFAFVDMLV